MSYKVFFGLFVFCFTISISFAQSSNQDSFKQLVNFLNNEDWEHAAESSDRLLRTDEGNELASVLRFMNIISQAGLLNKHIITKEEAQKRVNGFKGKNVTLPAHPISIKEGSLNSVLMVNNRTDTLFITATNKKATEIYAFEYIIPEKPFSAEVFKSNVNKGLRISGRLKSIIVEGNLLPRYKIIIDKAEAALL